MMADIMPKDIKDNLINFFMDTPFKANCSFNQRTVTDN